MRTKTEIMAEADYSIGTATDLVRNQRLLVETNLDIRDLLVKLVEKRERTKTISIETGLTEKEEKLAEEVTRTIDL
jgi:hypothetical protein